MRVTPILVAVALLVAVVSPMQAAATDTPPHDDYADATSLTSLPFAEAYDPRGATVEPTETFPDCAGSPEVKAPAVVAPAPTTWYRIVPDADTALTVDPEGSDGSVSLGLFDVSGLEQAGITATAGTQVACARRSAGPLRADLVAGRTYMVQTWPRDTTHLALSFTSEEAPQLPEPLPLEVVADDGVVLRGHVHLPEGDGPFAPVLEFSPYYANSQGNPTDAGIADAPHRTALLDAGFAVALVSTRGSGRSDGCLQMGSSQEGLDAAAVVEALADADWSTGRVGMVGASYPAYTALGALASGEADALDAVVAASPTVDLWQLVANNGVPYDGDAGWLSVVRAAVTAPTQPTVTGTSTVDHAACPSVVDFTLHDTPVWNGDRTSWHDDRDLRDGLRGVDVPVLASIGLWRDSPEEHDRIGQAPSWEPHNRQMDALWSLLEGDRWFVLGQHGHQWSTLPGFYDHAVDWFHAHLRDPDVEISETRVDYQSDDGAWLTTDAWPPPARDALHFDGSQLSAMAPTDDGQRAFQAANRPPLGCDAAEELVYVSEPLAADLDMAGQFTLDVTLTSDLPDGTVGAMLYVGDPCGDLREVSHALVSLRHIRDSRGADFPVGSPTPISIDSVPFATTIPAGERLVLAIGSAGWNTVPDPFLPRITVHTGPDQGSGLHLPLPCDRPGDRTTNAPAGCMSD